MEPSGYVDEVGRRLSADGSQVSTEELPGGDALVGRRSDFRLRWMATQLHLFTVVRPVAVVTADALRAFTEEALAEAVRHKGALGGLQQGVGVIPVLVGSSAEPEALQIARKDITARWAAFAWPAVVDLGTGQVVSHEGRVKLGGIYAGWMRERTAAALPVPSDVAA